MEGLYRETSLPPIAVGAEICITFWESESAIYITNVNKFPTSSDTKMPLLRCEFTSRNPVNMGERRGCTNRSLTPFPKEGRG